MVSTITFDFVYASDWYYHMSRISAAWLCRLEVTHQRGMPVFVGEHAMVSKSLSSACAEGLNVMYNAQ